MGASKASAARVRDAGPLKGRSARRSQHMNQGRSCDAPERHREILQRFEGLWLHHPDDGGKDVFVHVTAVEHSGLGALTDGQRVSFETEPDKRGKGPKAVELQPAT